MQLIALKRWHWIVIALIVGFLVAGVRQATQDDLTGIWVDDFGYRLSDPAKFEYALTQEFQGNRLFKDITVYPRWIKDAHAGRKLVHVVAGRYWNGQLETSDGAARAVWRPTCFIAAVPYRPANDLSLYNKPDSDDFGKRFRATEGNATVLDLLNVMHSAAGVSYRYAWWDAYPYLAWVGGSLLLIGIAWPTLINLLAFGKLTRPPEAKAISLWSVRNVPSTAQKTLTQPTQHELTELDAELEAAIQSPPAEAEPASAAPARTLSSTPLELAPVDAGPSKEFGAKQEDYYPTERRAPRRT